MYNSIYKKEITRNKFIQDSKRFVHEKLQITVVIFLHF